MLDLDQAIREGHSTRMFLPEPVPREFVDEALALAQYAPSHSNIQPWLRCSRPEFFSAPLAGVACMHRNLGPADALSAQLAIPAELSILCGLAGGFPTQTSPPISCTSPRPIGENVVFLDN
jgi:hypothetical protein